ncbi:hypothetical protein RclHR1_09150007 [Rhizophagus clarus]|uniref:Uncharacterized protein n=1 Tax=Rhizophagus clarus TaxID=94130 RepID=A0A2Z6S3K4_9GLOM|nr:hypothetical protein RclHR1_09150007 [Rhizophagus clarus]
MHCPGSCIIPAVNIINAFDIIRASSNDICVPGFNDLPKNALEKLRIDLSNWIKNHGGGWKGKDAARHIGKQFVTDLASALCLIEISYYSNGLFKEALCFNCGVECEEHTNYGEYFPYCEDCNTLVKNKKRKRKEKKFVKSSKQRNDVIS